MLLPRIKTERLLLRTYTTDDLESVYLIISDKDVMRFFSADVTVERETVLTSLPRRMEKWKTQGFGQFGVFDKRSEKLIGYCGLQYLDNTNEVEIYYGFFKDFWGKGLATEAAKAVLRFGFEQVELEKIVAVTHPENTASQKVLLKLSFKQKENTVFYGVEAAYFAMMREDFQINDADVYQLEYKDEFD